VTEQRRLGGRLVTTGSTDGAGPPVVLLGGCGVPHSIWEPVLMRMEGRRVVWVDRPGLGGTPWPGRVPTLSEEVATLAELAAREDGPVVWVAHSMAGPHAEAVTRQYPRLVGGLVLVDSSVEWRVPGHAVRAASWERFAGMSRWLLGRRLVGALAQAVVGGPLASRTAARRGITANMRDELGAVLVQPDTVAMSVAEFGGYAAQIVELYAIRARHRWPGVPTEVLTARRGTSSQQLAAQARLARLLDGVNEVVDAGHTMMLDQPDAIVDSVERVSRHAG